MRTRFRTYRITYQNGTVQTKNLIDYNTYQGIKYLNQCIIDFESQMVGLSKKSKQYKNLEADIKDIEDIISGFGDFFVEGSPLHKSMFNGGKLILPKSQGGMQSVIVEQIN